MKYLGAEGVRTLVLPEFSHTWLDRGGPEGALMELNGSPQTLARYGASALSALGERRW